MTRRRTRGGHSERINQKFVHQFLKAENAPREIVARKRTTVSRNSTILTNTKPSFAHHTLIQLESASMEIIAPLHTLMLRFLLRRSINLREIQTSICFISKQYGAHIMKLIIREINVSMHTIGKISEGSPKFISIIRNSVEIGDLRVTQAITRMGVQMSTDVQIAMVGRNKNIIQNALNSVHVNTVTNALNRIALISIMNMTRGSRRNNFSKFSRKPVSLLSLRTTTFLT